MRPPETRGIRIAASAIVGLIFGVIIGAMLAASFSGRGAIIILGAVGGGIAGAVVGGLVGMIPRQCCYLFSVFMLASFTTIGSFIIWHALLLALLLGSAAVVVSAGALAIAISIQKIVHERQLAADPAMAIS
jgi:hypothetical protein